MPELTRLSDFSSAHDRFWVRPENLSHPCFNRLAVIGEIISAVKAKIDDYLCEGLRRLDAQNPPQEFRLLRRAVRSDGPWLLALRLVRYGRIYFCSRVEARSLLGQTDVDASVVTDLAACLEGHGVHNRLFNFAVHSFVRDPDRKVTFQPTCVPPRAIQTLAKNRLCVRPQDFLYLDPSDSLETRKHLYDLHDFSHYTTASLCPQLYGNKYHPWLARLNSNLRKLVLSPRRREPDAPLSDGLIFSELLTPLFSAHCDEYRSDIELQRVLAKMVQRFLAGDIELKHFSSGAKQRLVRTVSPLQLAVLSQNKVLHQGRERQDFALAHACRKDTDWLPSGG